MKIHPEERARLLQDPRYQQLVKRFPLQEGQHAENLLIKYLPEMSDEAFIVFTEFVQHQSEVSNGVALHTEQVARLASFLVLNQDGISRLRMALTWLREKSIGIATTTKGKGCNGASQSFWNTIRKGIMPKPKR